MTLIEYRDATRIEFYPWNHHQEEQAELRWNTTSDPAQEVLITICYHVTGHSRAKVHAILLPRDASEDLLATLLQVFWVLLPRNDRNRKIGPIIEAWDFVDEHLTLYATVKGKPRLQTIAEQARALNARRPSYRLDNPNDPNDIIHIIRSLGPGIATVSGSTDSTPSRTMEFDISDTGQLGEDASQDAQIVIYLTGIFMRGPASLIVRTFTQEFTTIRDPRDPLRIQRVPVKELRGFAIVPESRANGIFLSWMALSPDQLRASYQTDAQTHTAMAPPSDRDHRYLTLEASE